VKVVIRPPTEIEARNIRIDKESIALEPVFYQPKGRATIGIVEVARNDGAVVFRGILSVNGKSGSVDVDQRTRPVIPALDTPKKGSKS
jgi:hypothetical protein